MFLGKHMLCCLLKQIYLDHIHPSLLGDEFIYSAEVIQTFLDLWHQPNNTKTHPDFPNSLFYCINDEYLFELSVNQNLNNRYIYCHYDKVWSIISIKYDMKYYHIQCLIKNVVENTLQLGQIIPSTTLYHPDIKWVSSS